jgi:hypothetical protein
VRAGARLMLRWAIVALAFGAFGATSRVAAQPTTSGPVVTLERTDLNPGDRVIITLEGFDGSTVTVSVCGNAARRGSSDCNVTASQTVELEAGVTASRAEVSIASPPTDCPCVLRVASRTNDQIAIAPITLIGHPVGPIVGGPDPNTPLVAIAINAEPKPHGLGGWIRANLGGRVPYEVTVTVKNLSTDTLTQVGLYGSVGRSVDGAQTSLALDDPGSIAPGQTWQQVVFAEVPAPSFNSAHWQVVAARAGPMITQTLETRHRPILLMLLAAMLVADIGFLAMRSRTRRRLRRVTVVDDVDEDSTTSAKELSRV